MTLPFESLFLLDFIMLCPAFLLLLLFACLLVCSWMCVQCMSNVQTDQESVLRHPRICGCTAHHSLTYSLEAGSPTEARARLAIRKPQDSSCLWPLTTGDVLGVCVNTCEDGRLGMEVGSLRFCSRQSWPWSGATPWILCLTITLPSIFSIASFSYKTHL